MNPAHARERGGARFVRSIGAAVAVLALAGCSGNEGADEGRGACSEGAISRLYLGQDTPTGAVTDAQWRAFLVDAVAPRFPDGFTELQAHGHWRDPRGTTIEEDTRIVEIVHDGSPYARERVRAVAADYKRRFAQQSVLVAQSESFQCF